MICTVIDTETTGLIHKGAAQVPDPVQIAWVQFDDQSGRVLGMSSVIVAGDATVRPDAEAVHGISQDMRDRVGMREGFALCSLIGALETSRRAIAYNSAFDRNVLRHALDRMGYQSAVMERPRLHWIDLMDLAQDQARVERDDFLDFKWPSLDETLEALGIEMPRNHHHALFDALAAMKVYMVFNGRNLIEPLDGAQ